MASRWGDIQSRGISLSRITHWLGQRRRDPAADPPECPHCHDDGWRETERTYCKCAQGQALLASDLDIASDAARTPHHGRKAA